MNTTATYYLACNACTIAMTDFEVLIDPKVEDRIDAAGRLYMGTGRTTNYTRSCDFCESETEYLVRWDRY